MSRSRVVLRLSVVMVWLCLLGLGGAILAQGGAVPIQIGQNATGTLSAEANTALFAVTTTGGETAVIQVLALSPGFAPRFSVLNAAGVAILTVDNPAGQATVSGNAAFSDVGVYTIAVQGQNGSAGQFVLSLQPGAPLPQPIVLTVDQPVSGIVSSQAPVQVYRFKTTSLGTFNLTVLSQTPGSGPLITLFDESAGKTIASSDAGVIGVAYQLPAEDRLYRVEVRAAGTTATTAYAVCAGSCGSGLLTSGATAVPVAATLTPTPQVAAAACSASSSVGGAANLRGGPGTIYQIRGSLPPGQTIPVIGVWTQGGWYEVNANGQALWVGASVVNLNGDCAALPFVEAPVNAPLAPTQAPTQASTLAPPIQTPEVEPSATTPALLPDLTIINLQISQNVDGNGSLGADVTILNNGTAMLIDNSFAIQTCADGFDNCVENYVAFNLQPGETQSLSYRLPSFSGSGNHTVNVTVDSHNDIDELDESNNSAFASFNI